MESTSVHSPSIQQAKDLPYFTPANNAGAAINPHLKTPTLFRPLRIRDLTLKNRVIVAPMCTYSAESDPTSLAVGALTDFHIAHLGHLATKGVGLILIEATSVQPNGRISPNDSGLWQDGTESEQFKGLRRVVNFAHSQGAKIGVQLAHAGRKASTVAPWLASQAKQRGIKADESVGGWPSNVVGPSGGDEQIWAPGDQYWAPRELETAEVEELVRAFARSAKLAVQAGVDVIEIHAAHGYLLHQFLSPVTNRRTDKYGGSFENRTRVLCEVAAAIRAVIPNGMPLFLRISATDWLENQNVAEGTGSWDMPSSIQLAKMLPDLGIDFLDVSSGGNHKNQHIEPHTNYQIDLAGQIRQEIHAANHTTLVGAVGFITEAESARDIVQGAEEEAQAAEAMLSGPKPQADAVLMARQFLREPEWVLTAAKKLDVKISLPWQFARGLL
ncbi:Aldolase-type TIM barrel [Penicillium cf. griseofulvum]|nr:Aldolase-type TIM barrel [Penicillium cf. griseofulvum]KAJ5451752.1 Aldolase-type TIM barrel [Penicillium cf. griseofulvum]